MLSNALLPCWLDVSRSGVQQYVPGLSYEARVIEGENWIEGFRSVKFLNEAYLVRFLILYSGADSHRQQVPVSVVYAGDLCVSVAPSTNSSMHSSDEGYRGSTPARGPGCKLHVDFDLGASSRLVHVEP